MNASVCFVLHHVCNIFAWRKEEKKVEQTIFIKYEKTGGGVEGRMNNSCGGGDDRGPTQQASFIK